MRQETNAARAWQTWQMGVLERRDPAPKPESVPKPKPARRREDQISITLFNLAKEEAEQKGFDKGYAEGLERGYAEGENTVRAEHTQALEEQLAASVQPINELAAAFRQAIDGLNEQVSYALVEMALETAQKLSGRAVELKPEHILDDIEDLLEANPTLTGSPTLYVNIEDLSLVEAHLSDTLEAAGWHVRPDMGLQRGDCRIETDQREIDATAADRWSRLLHAVGHGEH